MERAYLFCTHITLTAYPFHGKKTPYGAMLSGHAYSHFKVGYYTIKEIINFTHSTIKHMESDCQIPRLRLKLCVTKHISVCTLSLHANKDTKILQNCKVAFGLAISVFCEITSMKKTNNDQNVLI